jgi:sensor c-di-GMP phosphodiesterase-like protein
MHEAKRKDENQYEVFDAFMRAAAHARLDLESDLRRDVEREEFCLNYQPTVLLESVAMVGTEALLT